MGTLIYYTAQKCYGQMFKINHINREWGTIWWWNVIDRQTWQWLTAGPSLLQLLFTLLFNDAAINYRQYPRIHSSFFIYFPNHLQEKGEKYTYSSLQYMNLHRNIQTTVAWNESSSAHKVFTIYFVFFSFMAVSVWCAYLACLQSRLISLLKCLVRHGWTGTAVIIDHGLLPVR